MRTKQNAFTIVELLVVITIIAILTALLIPAVIGAQKKARSTRIKIEVDQISMAFEDYKNDNGEYPPNTIVPNANAIVRHFKKAFPRHREPETLIRRLAVGDVNLVGGMTCGEAVVFWLGGFSSDPKYPISGPGGPSFAVSDPDAIESRQKSFDFELARIGTGAGVSIKDSLSAGVSRYLEYNVDKDNDDDPTDDPGEVRRINFWQYYPPNSTKPFVYFNTSRTPPSIAEHDFYDHSNYPNVETLGVVPVKTLKSHAQNDPPLVGDLKYANDDKFQILHAGVDDEWGEFHALEANFTNLNATAGTLLFPDGPFIGELGDTIVNFDERTLADAQP